MSIYIKEPEHSPRACIIWLHGLGADAQDMAGLAKELLVELPIRHVFLDAPTRPITVYNGMLMRGWYDFTAMTLMNQEDKEGILASEDLIRKSLEEQMQKGMDSSQIFLAGFSQGGAMALLTGLKSTYSLAGIIGLSTYIPLRDRFPLDLDKSTPLFLAAGKNDMLVLPSMTQKCRDWLKANGFENTAYHEYPMEHSVCMEEIKDLSKWLTTQIVKMSDERDCNK